ncbi:MAG: GNAT family N-acetyltransferase [Solirubrobacteraceae bacterium MAG38_C4-C5]|nr:GNAT family N-acetyltransferase [Candidatus Siliceabacter maunaloa]
MSIVIRRLEDADLGAVVAFSLAAWAPVFASLEGVLGPKVYGLLFPDWRSAQAKAVEATCRAAENEVWIAVVGDRPVGFVAFGFIDEDAAGEVHMVAVDPAHQGAGVGASLMRHAIAEIEAQGVELAVVATGGDPGHSPARALYEKLGFEPLHLVRYYREWGSP